MKTITISDETWGKIKDQVEEENKDIKDKKKINITIKNRWTGDIIYESEKTTYKEAVEDAVRSKANLSWADLSWADLSKANLSEANLNGTLYYMGYGNRNFEALCKAIKTIRHGDGKFEDLIK